MFQHNGGTVPQKLIDAAWEPVRTFWVMGNQPTFWSYYRRFFPRLVKDATPWARDNLVFASCMIFLPVLGVWVRDRNHAIDWDILKTTLWLYLIAFGFYTLVHAALTAWKLDSDRARDLHESKQSAASLELQIAQLTQKPDVKADGFGLSKEILDFVYERAQKAPPLPTRAYGFDEREKFLKKMREDSHLQTVFNGYQVETLEIYAYRFKRRVLASIKSLLESGIRDEYFNACAENPKNVGDLKVVGTKLAELAEALPEPKSRTQPAI
jgi:hypothetical protein